MTVLHPGDSVHLTYWFNRDGDPDSEEKMKKTYEAIFAAHGVTLFSQAACYGGSPFPPQVIVFRAQESS